MKTKSAVPAAFLLSVVSAAFIAIGLASSFLLPRSRREDDADQCTSGLNYATSRPRAVSNAASS